MDPSLRAFVAATKGANWTDGLAASRPRRFSAELDRHGLFLRVGWVEAYLCTKADRAWSFWREPGGFDAQAWRLHLVVGRVPT